MGKLISSTPLESTLRISRGIVVGHSHINKFGGSPEVALGVQEDVWDGQGTYSFPATADITHIVQAVDQVAMRGEPIEVQGLDADWNLVLQTKALNAANTTTAAALDTPLRRVFRMKVLADVVGDQIIHAQNVGAGTQYASILAGNNKTLMTIYTVPSGVTAYLTRYYAAVIPTASKNPTATEFKVWSADRGNGYEFELEHADGATSTKVDVEHEFNPYLRVPQKSDIKITALPNDKAAKVYAGFDLILVDN